MSGKSAAEENGAKCEGLEAEMSLVVANETGLCGDLVTFEFYKCVVYLFSAVVMVWC